MKIGGHTESYSDDQGRYRVRWVPAEMLRGIANDTPILGHGVNTTNLLRLWSAEAPMSFDYQAFNLGDYYGAVLRKVRAETVSKVLYPNDEPETGKRLRLIQQHFFVSCSLQDMLRIYLASGAPLERLHEKYAAQLNDTHPAISVAELMRVLVDEHGQLRVNWVPDLTVYGKAYDTPILGYGVANVNLLRLWKSEPRESFDFQALNTGNYYGAVNDMVVAQNLSKVLYPNDEPEAGKELRLKAAGISAN